MPNEENPENGPFAVAILSGVVDDGKEQCKKQAFSGFAVGWDKCTLLLPRRQKRNVAISKNEVAKTKGCECQLLTTQFLTMYSVGEQPMNLTKLR